MQLEFNVGYHKKYEVDGIWDNTVYIRESVRQLSGLYFLVSWKSYPKKENTLEPTSAI